MAVARDDLGRAARKRGIEGQVTIIRHFGIRCIGIAEVSKRKHSPHELIGLNIKFKTRLMQIIFFFFSAKVKYLNISPF